MLLLGIDLGTSSIKVSVADAESQTCIASAQYPDTETGIIAPQAGWAEQDPETWWEHVQEAILKCNALGLYDPKDIAAIGIAYQMHGLVLLDKDQKVLRHAIIWCDGRAVNIGDKAFQTIGEKQCLGHLLNSPGNFTASKLAWVKQNEPHIYQRIDKIMLPGDFIAARFTGKITTTVSALSEGIFWDFQEHKISESVLKHFDFEENIFAKEQAVFSKHGELEKRVATNLSLRSAIPVTYKAGDQLNNALSLNVMQPGEVAATAGTSGVIYGVSDQLNFDEQSRINSFAHLNHEKKDPRIGILLCINGAGIMNRWLRNLLGTQFSYQNLNEMASKIEPGSNGLITLPFGNGPERMLSNKTIGAQFSGLDLNLHSHSHMVRSAQEGVAFAFRYGLDIMRENGMLPSIIRAGKANMFLSDVFTESFVNVTGVPVELYQTDGSMGAAIGAGIGLGHYGAKKSIIKTKALKVIEPFMAQEYENLYSKWKAELELQLEKTIQ